MPVLPVSSRVGLSDALVRFHRRTDARTVRRELRGAHADWLQVRAERDRHLGQAPARARSQGLLQAAALVQASAALAVREEFAWTRQLVGFNQLPAAGAGGSLFSGVRRSLLGMAVGLVGKTASLALAVALLPTLALVRRSLDWALHFSHVGVPKPMASNAAVSACKRQFALANWLRRHDAPIDGPSGERPASCLLPADGARRAAAAQALLAPGIDWSGIPLGSLARPQSRLGSVLPALSLHVNKAALDQLFDPRINDLSLNERPFALPAAYLASSAAPTWSVHLALAPRDRVGPRGLLATCSTTVPVGNHARWQRRGDGSERGAALRVPMELSVRLRLLPIANTVDADIEPMSLMVAHDADRPLWFPLPEPAAASAQMPAPRSAPALPRPAMAAGAAP